MFISFYEHSSVSGKLQERRDDDEQCVGDNCIVPVVSSYDPCMLVMFLSGSFSPSLWIGDLGENLRSLIAGTFSPFQELRRKP
jgi:hypothetical protein